MAENLTICIAREFGSGGHAIGKTLAEKTGIRFYDKELLKYAAEKSGILQELFEKADEKPTSSLQYSLSSLGAGPIGAGPKAPSYADYAAYLPNDRIQNVIADVIREAAEHSPCVIIGRCADYILRGRPTTFSVFIHSNLEKRIQRVAKLHNLDEDAARSLVRKTDRSRANYYSFYTDREWGLADNYDLTFDAGKLDVDRAVELIQSAAKYFCPQYI